MWLLVFIPIFNSICIYTLHRPKDLSDHIRMPHLALLLYRLIPPLISSSTQAELCSFVLSSFLRNLWLYMFCARFCCIIYWNFTVDLDLFLFFHIYGALCKLSHFADALIKCRLAPSLGLLAFLTFKSMMLLYRRCTLIFSMSRYATLVSLL